VNNRLVARGEVVIVDDRLGDMTNHQGRRHRSPKAAGSMEKLPVVGN
jgi:hypothetical protein